MTTALEKPKLLLARPKIVPPLDSDFRPISLGIRSYLQVAKKKSTPLIIGLERNSGLISVYQTEISADPQHEADTQLYVDRLVKFLLWQRGGWKIMVSGPEFVSNYLTAAYSTKGSRSFDAKLMGDVYEKPFTVERIDSDKMPKSNEASVSVGGNLNGCRIGFDLGASDYKLAAVKEGEAVFTTEIPWDPRNEADPEFHYQKINDGLKQAASHLPKVDAIGGSSAGIYIDNKVMVASLFRAVPKDIFEKKVKNMFLRLAKEWQVPFEVANDGDVTALAGAMSLKTNSVLGIAMGSSEAAGYLDGQGRITGWLNELAFAPVDFNPQAAVDEWSGDYGCGALYFSQQAVVKLAPAAGIDLPKGHQAEQLKHVQDLHKKNNPRASKIFETIGVYLGYALAQYADMYDYRHVLVLGRVTSGVGGEIIMEKAHEVLKVEFPEYANSLTLRLPDEKSKRVGQAVAAASLPKC